ncbi:MAG: thioredoxin [Verrucomicrobiota bacterium]
MASDNVLELDNDGFNENVLKGDGKVLVDFWAEWCGPCKMIAPLLDEIADANVGKVKIAKVNVDQQNELATKYDVRAIPTMLIFENGELKDKVVGMTSKSALEDKLGIA